MRLHLTPILPHCLQSLSNQRFRMFNPLGLMKKNVSPAKLFGFDLSFVILKTGNKAKFGVVRYNPIQTIMDKKDIQLLEKLYAESDYKTKEEITIRFAERNVKLKEVLSREVIPEHLQGLNRDTILLRILLPSDVYAVLNIGLYNSYKNNDMSILNDALYSYNRLSYYKDLLFSSGTDHSKYLTNVVESLAGNDISLVKQIFTKEKGLTEQGNKFVVTTSNLIISLLHQDTEWLAKSVTFAEKYLTQKVGNFDRAVINYLISIAKNDFEKTSEWIFEICSSYKKANWLHEFENPFLKVLGLFPHGLYNLAYYTVPKTDFDRIEAPQHTVFWLNFSDYNRETGFTKGNRFITFDNELESLNVIYN